jgi:cysteine-rich repeat protein
MLIRSHLPLFLCLVAACGESPESVPLDTGNGRSDIAGFSDAGADVDDVDDVPQDSVIDDGSDALVDADSADAPPDVPPDVDVPDGGVGPAGGRVDFAGGWIIVPAGALSDLTVISIEPDFDATPPGFDIEGQVWRFEPDGLEFDVPFQVCLTIDGIRPANMTLHWSRPRSAGIFDPLVSSPVDGAVCGRIGHFSLGFLGRPTDTDCDGIDCQPTVGECPTTTSMIPSVLGTCMGGTCAYPIPAETPCEADNVCVDGACVAPARCGDNDVNADDEECDGDDFANTDCMSLGFDSGELGCSESCTIDSSDCSGDACADVTCDSPPDANCAGTIATTSGVGECVLGECAYLEDTEDCADSGEACVAGACVVGPGPGDLVITEIMANPTGDDVGLEWFELYNSSDRVQPLSGLSLSDDGVDALTVGVAAPLAPGAYAVLGASDDAADVVDVIWTDSGSYALSNTEDEIEIHFATVLVDRVAWGPGMSPPWERPNGASMSLDPSAVSAAANDSSAVWCAGSGDYGVPPNLGSPGFANGPCPREPECGDGVVDDGEECDDGNMEDGDGCQAECTVSDCVGEFDCDSPPDASCDGDRALTYPDGSCAAGLCVYEATATECAEAGLDCADGSCVRAPATYGELVITEFMANVEGDDTGLEWFEIHNPTAAPISLEGFTIRDDGTNSFDVSADISVPAGDYLIVGESAAAVPGGVDLAWDDIDATFALANTEDEIVIEWRGSLVDRVAFTGSWPVSSGVSLALNPSSLDADSNDADSNWCAGIGDYGVAPNVGSPGAANPDCGAGGVCGDGSLDEGESCDDGNTEDGDGCSSSCALEPEFCSVSEDCDTPPANFCESTITAIRFGAGECIGETCSYPEMPVSCTLETICSAGDCVPDTMITRGELVITEYLANPEGTDTGLEWFEVYNNSDRTLDLNGLSVGDIDGVAFTIDVSIEVPARAHFVFAESASAVPSPAFDWTAAGSAFTLANTSDEIILTHGRTELDQVIYDSSWPDSSGVAAQLNVSAFSVDENDDESNWCPAETEYGVGTNAGSPGGDNILCR